MMKRLLTTLAVITLVFSWPFLASAKKAKPIKLGVVYSFSGPTAMLCGSITDGHKVAAKEINKAGGIMGRPVELIVRDDAGNPELTTRYCKELITKYEVDWLLAGHGMIKTLAAQAVA